jgi:2-iminobutanoate/2-iminopropanoate deaminase
MECESCAFIKMQKHSFCTPFFQTQKKQGKKTMTLKVIATQKAPAAIGPYSQAVATDQLLFVSGQLGLIPESGQLAGSDLASQTRQALKNMSQIIHSGGSHIDNVLSVDVFLTDIDDFTEFNDIYQDFFTIHKPSRAVVGVNGLPKGALVEIKCIAWIASQSSDGF